MIATSLRSRPDALEQLGDGHSERVRDALHDAGAVVGVGVGVELGVVVAVEEGAEEVRGAIQCLGAILQACERAGQ